METQAITQSPFRKYHPPISSAVRWTEGFLPQRAAINREHTLESVWRRFNSPGSAVAFKNFEIAAGLTEGDACFTEWSDGDCYKWIEAAAWVYGETKDEELNRRMDETIALIAKAQEDDGYLDTTVQIRKMARWTKRSNHEDYNLGHLLTAACVHHQMTAKTNFLHIAVKAADYLYATFSTKARELAHAGWNPSWIMGAVDIYRETGDKKYLELAELLISLKGSHPEDTDPFGDKEMIPIHGGDQNQDRVPLREESLAEGHAVTGMYLYAGAADYYAESGDKEILDALLRIWEDVQQHKVFLTGGIAGQHHGASSRDDFVHEAFAYFYQLHNANAYNETCATIANAMFNWRLFNILGEARFADMAEQVLYNGWLSAVSNDGERFFYSNPLRYSETTFQRHRDFPNMPEQYRDARDVPHRWDDHSCLCCPPQIARSMAWLRTWLYSLGDDEVSVNFYGGSALSTAFPGGHNSGKTVTLEQQSNYPWDGAINITISDTPEQPWTLSLRIPGWVAPEIGQVTLTLNGESVKPNNIQAGNTVRIERNWRAGDVVELNLPMVAHLLKSHPMVEENRNMAAVQRGPVVYCLEACDLPQGVEMNDVYLPRNAQFEHRFESDILGGLVTLHAKAARLPEERWDGKLYQVINVVPPEPIDIVLLPYFAWANRKVGPMTVWLPMV